MPGKGVGEPGTAGAGPAAGANAAGFVALAGGPTRLGGGAAGLTDEPLPASVAADVLAFVPPARRRGNLPPGVAGGFVVRPAGPALVPPGGRFDSSSASTEERLEALAFEAIVAGEDELVAAIVLVWRSAGAVGLGLPSIAWCKARRRISSWLVALAAEAFVRAGVPGSCGADGVCARAPMRCATTIAAASAAVRRPG
jgi:hypothetical protein